MKKHAFVKQLRLMKDEYEVEERPLDQQIIQVERVAQVDEASYVYHGWQYSILSIVEAPTLSEVQENSLQADHARYTLRIVPLDNTTCHSYLYRSVDYLLKIESVLNTKVHFEIAAA